MTNEIVAQGVKYYNDICCLFLRVISVQANVSECSATSLQSLHESLGHVNIGAVKRTISNGAVADISDFEDENFFCEGCAHGKTHKLPYYRNRSKRNHNYQIGESLHTDLCGPMSLSLGGNKYFMVIKDRVSNYRFVYFLKFKSEAFMYLKELIILINSFYNRNIKIIRCDCGKEFENRNFLDFLKTKGIKFGPSAPYCQHQNGRAERENRIIIESARSMLHSKKDIPRFLWAEAVNTAVYAINRTLSSNSKGQTPYELWHGEKPKISHMRPFGTPAFVYIPKEFRRKFDSTAYDDCILVGYEEECENYRIYNSSKAKVIIVRNVCFNLCADDGLNASIPVCRYEPKIPTDCIPQENNDVFENAIQQLKTLHISRDDAGSSADDVTPQPVENVNNNIDKTVTIDKAVSIPNKSVKRKLNESIVTTRNLRERKFLKRPKRYQPNFVEVVEPIRTML